MRDIRKAVCSTLIVLLLWALVSMAVFEGYFQTTRQSYQDASIRRALAGTLDTIFLGSSQGENAFLPTQFNADTGASSFNLGSAMITMQGRYDLLKKELGRNPVRTVYLEFSYESFSRDRRTESNEGELYLLGRWDNVFERIRFCATHFSPREYRAVYTDTFKKGIDGWKELLSGDRMPVPYPDTLGYHPTDTVDLSLPAEVMAAERGSVTVDTTQQEYNLRWFREIVLLCRENNVELVLVTVPICPTLVGRIANLDAIREQLDGLATQYGLRFYDFNLLIGNAYSATDSFCNEQHMSQTGAARFTADFTAVLAREAAGEETSSLFYPSYAALAAAQGTPG